MTLAYCEYVAEKQCEAMDVGSSEVKTCTHRQKRYEYRSENGFVFDEDTFGALVEVPPDELQKKQGIKSTGIKYHSLVAETGARGADVDRGRNVY